MNKNTASIFAGTLSAEPYNNSKDNFHQQELWTEFEDSFIQALSDSKPYSNFLFVQEMTPQQLSVN